jgi:hypothetical protein
MQPVEVGACVFTGEIVVVGWKPVDAVGIVVRAGERVLRLAR